MTLRIFTIALLLTCGACDAGPAAPNANSRADAPESPGAKSSQPDLAGDWQVASIDGTLTTGIRLTGSGDALIWKPECAGQFIHFRQAGQAIEFRRSFDEATAPPAGEDDMLIVCEIGFPKEVPEIFQLLPSLDTASQRADGRLVLAGNGHELVLERPKSRSELAVPTLAGRWRVSVLDGKTLNQQAHLDFVADDSVLVWEPRCAQQARSYYIESDRFAARRMPPSPPPPPGANVPVVAVCTIGLPPSLVHVFTALEAATSIKPATDGGVILQGNGHDLTLKPLTTGTDPRD